MSSLPEIAIERLRPDDRDGLTAVSQLEREAFPEDAQTAPNLALMARIGDVWVARDAGCGIIAEAIIMGGVGEPRVLLFSLAVTSAWRRRGVGLALMRAVFASLVSRGVRVLELTVDPANEAALGLYISKLGCDFAELVPDHFGPGRPRQVLRKMLVSESL